MKAILSSANPAYRNWLRLARQPREVRRQRRTLAEGLHLAAAAIDHGHPIETALLRAKSPPSAERDRLLEHLRGAGVTCVELASDLYDALALVEHGVGLALVIALPDPRTTPLAGDAVYLDAVQEPGNAGALLRVAAAAGVRHVLAGPGSAALWAAKVLRAAQGAHFVLDLREDVAPGALGAPPYAVLWVAATAADAIPLWSADLPAAPLGWVFGSEGLGLSAAALAVCRLRVRIPLASAVESLNVASAAAVCLFERRRRQGAAAD